MPPFCRGRTLSTLPLGTTSWYGGGAGTVGPHRRLVEGFWAVNRPTGRAGEAAMNYPLSKGGSEAGLFHDIHRVARCMNLVGADEVGKNVPRSGCGRRIDELGIG